MKDGKHSFTHKFKGKQTTVEITITIAEAEQHSSEKLLNAAYRIHAEAFARKVEKLTTQVAFTKLHRTQNRTTRDYAVLNNTFSLKTKGGYWTPEGKFLKVPVGIVRQLSPRPGWKLNYWNRSAFIRETRIVLDTVYSNSYEASLKAAVNALRESTLKQKR